MADRDPYAPHLQPRKTRNKTTLIEWLLFGVIGLIVVIGGIALYTHFGPSFKEVPNTVKKGFDEDRINILLIGIGGDTHPGEGKDLADAIMVLSLKPSTKQAALVSISRDWYMKIGRFGMHRLNAAHAVGARAGYPGEGPGLLVDTVAEIIGQPIHAFVRVDFAAFEKIIDELGGVDIYVYRPFYDYLFKDEFKQGWQHMSGRRALHYARYRYVRASAEGNNFARELRQQQVITAIKDKIRSLSPQQALRLVGVARAVSKHTTTNLTTGQMIELYSLFRDIERSNIRHVSLKSFTEIIMVTTPGDSGEAVQPKKNDYSEIHRLAATVFSGDQPIVMPDEIQLTDVGVPPVQKTEPAPKPVAAPLSR